MYPFCSEVAPLPRKDSEATAAMYLFPKSVGGLLHRYYGR